MDTVETSPAGSGDRGHGHNRGPLSRDEITAMVSRSWDELYGMDAPETAAFQLAAARRRFEEQVPLISTLRAKVESADVTRLDRLEDIVPLLFPDSLYKSYPISLIEKNRFDLLTKWLAGLTSVDLSDVDMAACKGIDDWLAALEMQSPIEVIHTSGTSGKLSFFPRSTVEIATWFESFARSVDGFGSEPGARLGRGGERMPIIFPTVRYGRYIAQRNLRLMEREIAPSPDQVYTLSNGTLSADLVALSGRIRVAQAKGELAQMKLSEAMRIAMRRYLEELDRRPRESAEFFQRITDELRGQRVFLSATSNILFHAAETGLARGISGVFAADSVGMTGGGGKDVELPPDWLDIIREFTGIPRWNMNYGMSELVGVMPMCPQGRYHIPPYYIPFLLDPESGALLPRMGVVTGRFSFLDLLAQTNWGGIISGDKVTVNFDGGCACGRKGPYVHADITRYSAEVTGEDKITCSATVDNTDAALQQLLAI